MSKATHVIEYYRLCNRLKDVIRTGWKDWNVQRDRIESVAEHIYSTQMVAISMYSEYHYDLDLKKVLYMLAIHELEEIIIGDLTLFDISKEEKLKKGHEAVRDVVKDLQIKYELFNLIAEFDDRKSKEAQFAFQCDKLECDLQSVLYDEQGCVDLQNQPNNIAMQDETVQALLNQGESFSSMWIQFSQNRYPYDANFLEVLNTIQKAQK